MNKNLNNQEDKGSQGGQIHNQGIGHNGSQISEKGINRADSWSKPNKNEADGSPSSRTQAMNNRGQVFKSSTFQGETQNRNLGTKLAEELTAPVITGTALYVIAALLLIGWAVGFFYYNAGSGIHVLLALALVSVLIRVVQGRNY